MKISFCHTLRKYNKSNLFKDILTGIIIAAVSIPISMGYSQIAGLPAVYGLYGSVFPILIFALFSTSPQLVFGVDAAPAALVGAALVSLGISPGSEEAMRIVPVITFFVALWLMLFYIFKAGKLVNYISKPVMGGFISGICSTIILMQIPKLYGASAGTGELFELLKHIYETIGIINVPSLLLGIITLIILIVAKKLVPKFPMAVVMMVVGAVVSYICPLDELGVTLLSSVEKGLPKFLIPDIAVSQITDVVGISLSVAVVIMAETLLAENNFAQRNGYKLDDNQEILAFSLGNFAAAFTGCCPINGSVSRTTMGEQYGGKTQLTSIVAGLTMMALLICGTGFIGYLPVPVLTAIVISALMGAVEFHLAAKLWKVSRTEFYIFCGAFLGVLVLGR
jgi:MFS superfamily sulfate permease-like transporter